MAKKNVFVKIIVDTREKDTSWLDKFDFNKRFGSDKIKIEGYEIKTFKCLDKDGKVVKTSTGDIGIEYSFDGETWHKTNLAIELKRDSDFSTTLYSNWKRFSKEVERAKEYGLDFYMIYNQSSRKMLEEFDRLKYMRRLPFYAQPHKVVYDKMIELVDSGVKLIYTHQIEEVVKRVIKNYIKKNKIQY